MSSNVLIAIAVILVGAGALSLLLKKVRADEAKWFAAILQSTDQELSSRSFPALSRDCSRMQEILLDLGSRAGVSRSWITADLGAEQLGRLKTALNSAARRHHENTPAQSDIHR